MLTKDERFKLRLQKDRPRREISITLPEDVIELMDEYAPALNFDDHKGVIMAFISEGLRTYEARAYAYHDEKTKQAAIPAATDFSKQAS